jgi:hypothetical protein
MSGTHVTSKQVAPTPPVSQARRYLNGAVSGVVEVTLTHWLDVLKTRWQAEAKIAPKDPNAPKLSTAERIMKIYRNEGFRGFYRGYVSRVLGIGPMRATYWGVMDHTTHILEPVKQLNQWQRLVVAGLVAGAAQSIVDVPIEVVKTQFITGNKNISAVLTESLKFRGFKATISRNMGFAAVINFGLNYKRTENTTYFQTYIRSIISGFFAAFLTQPLDFVKTKHQQVGGDPSVPIWKVMRDAVREHGLFLLWTGGHWRIALSMCTMSVGASVFVFLKSLDEKRHRQQQQRFALQKSLVHEGD